MTDTDIPMFSPEHFLPHGQGVLWMNVIPDILIAMAYFAIPFVVLYVARRRRDLPRNWLIVWFSVFILACGATHVMSVWNVWHAHYWIEGLIKIIAAAAAVPTA